MISKRADFFTDLKGVNFLQIVVIIIFKICNFVKYSYPPRIVTDFFSWKKKFYYDIEIFQTPNN